MIDEMMENLAKLLREKGVNCRTVNEWIEGSKQKTRVHKDAEVRKFLLDRRKQGEVITLITTDGNLVEHAKVDELPVIYVQELVRDHILRIEAP